MRKSKSDRSKAPSEASSTSDRRRRTADDVTPSPRSRQDSAASTTTSSSSRRKSSRRDDARDEPDDADASRYANPYAREPYAYPDLPEQARDDGTADYQRRDSRRELTRTVSNGNGGRPDADDSNSRRDSRRSSRPDRKQSSRAIGDDDAAPAQNQPYGPSGSAASYYGDQGESVASQPGVRPNPPSILHSADQAHLITPSVEPNPPPEPSSQGQVGSAASFYAGDNNAAGSDYQSTPTRPGRMSGTKPNGTSGPYPPPPDTNASYANSSNPPPASHVPSQSGSHHFGGVAAGLAGAAAGAAGAYFLNEHHEHEQESHSQHYHNQQNPGFYSNEPYPNAGPGQSHSAYPPLQQRPRQRPRGPVGKVVNWLRDPDGVGQYEEYSQAIGVCRDCFDPNSSPLDAPRRHYYHRRRPSGGRYGSSTRVDKPYRYSSSDDDKRKSSTIKKAAAGGLAGLAAAKIGDAIYKKRNDFDDTYSVKSGQPASRSRVSFADDQGRNSTRTNGTYPPADDYRPERRDSDRKSRRDDAVYEKRSSRRRDSSPESHSHGISAGTVLGIGAGAAAAAALHNRRRRSRSRTPSPSRRGKGYYSKRISPQHSYVDLTTTNPGPLGLGRFFSPSANKRKGKKSKGFFNFANASSSSSDADLAFGEGTVRRRDSNRKSKDRQDRHSGSTAALAGLAATGVALAAESDRRKRRAKDEHYADGKAGRYAQRNRVELRDHETTTDGEHDEAWEDVSDDDDHSSIDTALAYGGGLSAKQSRESLNQGTNKWDWRWRDSRDRRNHRPESPAHQSSNFGSGVAAAAAGAAIGAGIAAVADADKKSGKQGSVPPMQHVDPVPISDSATPRYSTISEVSPMSGTPAPQRYATSDPVPLQQPQPVVPIGRVPGAFDGAIEDSRRIERDQDRTRRPRRDSSPAKLPSRDSRTSVSFALPDGHSDKEQQRKSRREEKQRRKSADPAILYDSTVSRDKEPRGDDAEERRRAAREAEIEAELKRLYEEDRRQTEERKRKPESKPESSGVGTAAAIAAAAVGAGVAASALSKREKRSGSIERERERPVRKSSLKKTKEVSDLPPSETQRDPSPGYVDYSRFFTPTDIAAHVREHNEASAHADHQDPHVIEITPGQRKNHDSPFDSFVYRPFGTRPNDDPRSFPWPVPTLELEMPTPEGSRAHTPRAVSPLPDSSKERDTPKEDVTDQSARRTSRVKWGDDDVNVYEAMTPEYERTDFIADSPQKATSPTTEEPPAAPQDGSPRARETSKSKLSRAWTVDDDATNAVEGHPEAEVEAHPSIPGEFKTEEDAPPAEEVPAGARPSKSERRRMERAAAAATAVAAAAAAASHTGDNSSTHSEHPHGQGEERSVSEHHASSAPATESVFDYLVDEDGKSLPPASALGAATASTVSTQHPAQYNATPEAPRYTSHEDAAKFSKPKRATSFDESRFDHQQSKSKLDYSSDPEHRNHSSSSKKGREHKSSAVEDVLAVGVAAAVLGDDFYESEKRKRKAKRASEARDDADARSVVSAPAETKAGRRSKRESKTYDDNDDDRSIASSYTDSNKSKAGRDRDKEKRSSSGLWGSIISTISDVGSSGKKSNKSSKSEDRAERDRDRARDREGEREGGEKRKKRRSVGTDLDDAASVASEPARKGRREASPPADRPQTVDSRDQSVDDGFVSAEESSAKAHEHPREAEPFLAERPDMPKPMDIPMATDGVSGLASEGPAKQSHDVQELPRSTAHEEPIRETEHETPTEPSTPELRRISALKTQDLPSSPVSSTSPTSVPLFRRTPRASSISPGASPASPLTTPKSRQNRPHSLTSKEIRPLYLVQKTQAAKTPAPEVDEDLPSLPSSKTSSAHPSTEDLRAMSKAAEAEDYFPSKRITAAQFRERGRRHSYSYWHDEPRRESPDYLDSRSATPTPANVQEMREAHRKKAKPKYEFHSPSELLQDPSLPPESAQADRVLDRSVSPLPSAVGAEQDEDSISPHSTPVPTRTNQHSDEPDLARRKSRSRSRSRSRGRRDTALAAGLGIVAGSALGLAAHELKSGHDSKDSKTRDASEAEDMYGDGPPPPAPSPPLKGEAPAEVTEGFEDQKRDIETGFPDAAATEDPALSKEESKKGKKDKKKKRKDSLAPLDIGKAEARDESDMPVAELQDDKPLTAAPAEASHSRHLEDAISTPLPQDEDRDLELNRTRRVQSALPERSDRASAFDEAFERAVRARGLSGGVTRDVAKGSFSFKHGDAFDTAKRDIASVDQSLDTAPSHPLPVEEVEEAASTSESSKKARKKSKKSSKLRDSIAAKDETSEDVATREATLGTESVPTTVQAEHASESLPEDGTAALARADDPNPFGDDFEIRKDRVAAAENDATPGESARDLAENVPASQPETSETVAETKAAEEQPEEVSWAPTSSKKDKKKKKKGQASAARDDKLPEDDTAAAAEVDNPNPFGDDFEVRKDQESARDLAESAPAETVAETKAAEEQPEEFSWAPTSKKDKKKKKKGQASAREDKLPEDGTTAAPGTDDPNPFGDDFEIRKEQVAAPENEATPGESARDLAESAPASQHETSETVAEKKAAEEQPEFSWAPTSKKDKKKKKKGQASAAREDTPPVESQQESTEAPMEESTATPEEEPEDSWAPATSKKGKKDKKDKKRKALDVAVAAIGAAAAGTVLLHEHKDKDVVAEPETITDTRDEAVDPAAEPSTEQLAQTEEAPAPAPEATTDDLDWTAPSSGKKGKSKKKKSKSIAFDDEDANTPSDSVPDEAPLLREADSAPTETPAQPEDVKESEIAPVDEPATLPRKLTKTEKKKAKKGKSINLADFADDAQKEEAQDAPAQVEDVTSKADEPSREVSADATEPPHDPSAAQHPLALDPAHVTGASAHELHDSQQHQDFLAEAHEKLKDFPSRPPGVENDLSEGTEPAKSAEKDTEAAGEEAGTVPRDVDDAPMEEAGQTPTEPEASQEKAIPVEAQEDDLFNLPVKKSKKDKKDKKDKKAKRKSIALGASTEPDADKTDEAEKVKADEMSQVPPDDVQGTEPISSVAGATLGDEAAASGPIPSPEQGAREITEPTETIPVETAELVHQVEPTVDDTPTETPAEETGEPWAMTGKKSKKDKKKAKKRGSLVPDASETASPAAETAEAGIGLAAGAALAGGVIAAATTKEPEIASAETPVQEQEDFFGPPSTKKGGKSKKKRKSLAWTNEEEPTSSGRDEAGETGKPVEEAASTEVPSHPTALSAETPREVKADDEFLPAEHQEADKDVPMEEAPEPAASLAKDEEALPTPVSHHEDDRKISEPLHEPEGLLAQKSEEVSKKTKKDKKKTRKSIPGAFGDEEEESDNTPLATPMEVDDAAVSSLAPAESQAEVQRVHTADDVAMTESTVNDKQVEPAVSTGVSRDASYPTTVDLEQIQGASAQAFQQHPNYQKFLADARAKASDFPAKPVEAPVAVVEELTKPSAEQSAQSKAESHDAVPAKEDDFYVPSKSKKDKKKKKRQSLADDMGDSSTSKKSAGEIALAAGAAVVGAAATAAAVHKLAPHTDEGSTHTTEHKESLPDAGEEDWHATQEKGKKKKNGKSGRHSTGLDDNDKAPDAAESRQDAHMDSDTGSNVSEATRERRRRRRSPPVWDGEEPPDLPRDRTSTPPHHHHHRNDPHDHHDHHGHHDHHDNHGHHEHHDDVMDTALGVAAGLGLAAATQDHKDRKPRERSPSRSRDGEEGWSFANVRPSTAGEFNRDSGVHMESPILQHGSGRDSGYVPGAAVAGALGEASHHEHHHHHGDSPLDHEHEHHHHHHDDDPEHHHHHHHYDEPEHHHHHHDADDPEEHHHHHHDDEPDHHHHHHHLDPDHIHHSSVRQPSPVEPTSKDRSSVVFQSTPERPHVGTLAAAASSPTTSREVEGASVSRDIFSPPPSNHPLSPPKSPLQSIPEHGLSHQVSFGGATSRDDLGLGAKSLGDTKTRTSSRRNLRGALASSPELPVEASSSRGPVDGSVGRDRDMAEQYEGYGNHPGSPMSPTRPPSITRRRSMQQIQDLQAKIDQLASENRSLAEAKLTAERHLEEFHLDRNRTDDTHNEALQSAQRQLQERDEGIARLKQEIDSLAAEHEALRGQHAAIVDNHEQERSQWQESSRELTTLRDQHSQLSTGMEDIIRHQVDTAVAAKTAEIERLHGDLERAKAKIRELQSQILERGAAGDDDVIVTRDEDYFEAQCQQLCQHVQQWVLRFSKFSDSRVCRTMSEVRDEKTADRFDNAILDGSDVDIYLADRVRRRDVFMSVVMTMIWEYVFTRYLFGMDRDQRQKLKQLEKNLSEVGPTSAVAHWRAMTLTLLSRREAFAAQREQDTEAVAREVYDTLARFLPPPGNLQAQILDSLRNVMRGAVNLSIEMRCQRAGYIMLPPLQPEYDTNGDLTHKVYFNASLMNERSGETTSNEALEAERAVVRMVLFPLVVKKGGDSGGESDEEIVVCPAQVLVAREWPRSRSAASGLRPGSRAASGQSQGNKSAVSLAASASGGDGMGAGEMI